MKKTRTIIKGFLVLMFFVMLVMGCSNDDESDKVDDTDQSDSGTIQIEPEQTFDHGVETVLLKDGAEYASDHLLKFCYVNHCVKGVTGEKASPDWDVQDPVMYGMCKDDCENYFYRRLMHEDELYDIEPQTSIIFEGEEYGWGHDLDYLMAFRDSMINKWGYLYDNNDSCKACSEPDPMDQCPQSGVYMFYLDGRYKKEDCGLSVYMKNGSIVDVGSVSRPGKVKYLQFNIRNFNDTNDYITNITLSNKTDFSFWGYFADENGNWRYAGTRFRILPTEITSDENGTEETGGYSLSLLFNPEFGGVKYTNVTITGTFNITFTIKASTTCDPRPCVNNTCITCSNNACQ